MTHRRLLAPSALAALTLAGCAGATHALPPARQSAGASSAHATLVVRVPATHQPSSARGPRYISAATRSMTIAVNGARPLVVDLVAGAPGCTTTPAGTSCSVVVPAPVGLDRFDTTMFDQTGGQGNALSHAALTTTIAPGQTNVVPIVLGGVIASISIALGGTSAVRGTPASVPVIVTARDASGAVILGDPYDAPIALTDSDASGATSLSQTQVRAPSDTVTLSYTGAALTNATIGVSQPSSGQSVPAVQSAVFRPRTASTTAWTTWGFDPQRDGENPAESALSSSNAAALHQAWSFALASRFVVAQPLVVPNVLVSTIPGGAYVDLVIVADEHANLYAVDAATGNLVWQRQLGAFPNSGCLDMPDQEFGISGTPAVDAARGRLYVMDGKLTLHAIDLSTGNDASDWPVGGAASGENFTLNHDYGAVLFDAATDRIVVPLGGFCDNNVYYGKVLAFSAATGAKLAAFQVIPTSTGDWGAGVWASSGPALDPAGGSVYVATGNAMLSQQRPYGESILRLDEGSLGLDAVAPSPSLALALADEDYAGGPSLFAPAGCPGLMAGQQKDGMLNLYRQSAFTAGSSVPALQSIPAGTATEQGVNLSTPAFSSRSQMLYVTVGSATPAGSVPALVPGLAAFTVQSCSRLSLAWNVPFAASGPMTQAIVAGGVAYAGDGAGQNVYAIDALSGVQRWRGGLSGSVYATPAVANGMLFVADWSGHLTAFTAH